MNFLVKGGCRVFQVCMKYGMYAMPWRTPVRMEGEGCLGQLAQRLKDEGHQCVLVVTDKVYRRNPRHEQENEYSGKTERYQEKRYPCPCCVGISGGKSALPGSGYFWTERFQNII